MRNLKDVRLTAVFDAFSENRPVNFGPLNVVIVECCWLADNNNY